MKGITRRGFAAFAVCMALAATFALTACASGGSEVSGQDRLDAKTVIKAASNVFASSENLDITSDESPITVSQNDPRFATFFEELSASKGMSDIDLSNCSFTVTVTSVTAATAREDSQQTNYRYAITKADMTINGKHISYDKKGFSY